MTSPGSYIELSEKLESVEAKALLYLAFLRQFFSGTSRVSNVWTDITHDKETNSITLRIRFYEEDLRELDAIFKLSPVTIHFVSPDD